MANVNEYYINEITKIPSNDPRFAFSNGKIFSDSEIARIGQKVTGVRAIIGDGFLNGIQFIYDNDPDLSECHGSSQGKLIEYHFNSDEYITKFSWISGCYDYYIDTKGALTWHVQVTTNRNTYTFGEEPLNKYCGGKKTYTIEADIGHRIVGIRCKARRNNKDAQPTDKIGKYGKAINVLFAISDVYQCELEHTNTFIAKKPSNDPRFAFSNGKIFSDSDYIQTIQRVTSVQATIGDNLVTGLQFIYDNDPKLSEWHGDNQGKLIKYNFDNDEYITKFSWISGWNNYYIDTKGGLTWHIQMTTNKNTYVFGDEPSDYYCGDKKTYTIEADTGYSIVGIRCKARRNDKDAQPTDKIGTYGKAIKALFSISDIYQQKLEMDTCYNDYYYVIHAKRLTEIKGATCDNCINKLQFVYDNDDTMTYMHGTTKQGEEPFSIQLNNNYIESIYYETAQCHDSKYKGSVLLTYMSVESNDEKCYDIGTPNVLLPSSFYHKHSNRLHSNDKEELWAFSGLYGQYMGPFLSYFKRTGSVKKSNVASNFAVRVKANTEQYTIKSNAAQNSTGNKILIVNVEMQDNNGNDVDKNVAVLLQNWRAWLNANAAKWKEMYGTNKKKFSYDCIPAQSEFRSMNCKVNKDDVQKAILSGQYEYITFHCHGNYVFVGNQMSLFDSSWVLDPKNQFKNMVFHFNCCECGYRLIDDYTKKSGLAASLVKAGAKAVFGYTVALSINDYTDYVGCVSGTSEESKAKKFILLNIRFIGAVDKAYIIDGQTPNAAAKAALSEFKKILKDTKSIFALDNTVLEKIIKDYEEEKKQADFVETTERYIYSLSGKNEKSRMDKINEYLSQKFSRKQIIIPYRFYFNVYFAKEHFVGPGEKEANKDLKKKNLGELCTQFGNCDSSSEL